MWTSSEIGGKNRGLVEVRSIMLSVRPVGMALWISGSRMKPMAVVGIFFSVVLLYGYVRTSSVRASAILVSGIDYLILISQIRISFEEP